MSTGCRLFIVKEGECASLTSRSGHRELKMGPCSFRPWSSVAQKMERYQCDGSHYLAIKYLDGTSKNCRGPASVFFDSCVHANITVIEAIVLAENEVMVVYKEDEVRVEEEKCNKGAIATNGSVNRRIVQGPRIFVPEVTEWIHNFSWHGTILANGKGSLTGYHDDKKVAHALDFTKLRLMPDQMYYTQRDVRTKDDVILNIHTMIFFECLDLERMLSKTNDPISDIFNAISADIMTYGASRTYEELLADSGDLSKLDTYDILIARMTSIGYKLLKVVYRGYTTSNTLQNMQEKSIASRTQMRLEGEKNRLEAEKKMDTLKSNESQRAMEELQTESKVLHELKMQEMKVKANEEILAIEHNRQIKFERERIQVKLEEEANRNLQTLNYLRSLGETGVDLTAYLVAKESQKPDFVFMNQEGKTSGGTAKNAPNLHLKLKDIHN